MKRLKIWLIISFDILPPKDADEIRKRVHDALQARIDAKEITAIQQFARYHTDILTEADYVNAYIWYSIAAALNMPEAHHQRDDVEGELTNKDLVEAQNKTAALFDKYNFTPLSATAKGGKMGIKVQWIIDGVMEVDAATTDAAELLVDEKLRGFINANPELTELFGANAIQGHAVIETADD